MPRIRSRVYRRSDSPFWQADWTDAEGRTHRQSTGCRDHGAAVAWLATREIERVRVDAGIPVARPVTLALAAAEYLVEHEPPIWAEKWHGTAEGMFRRQVLPHFGPEATVSRIDRAAVETFRAAQLRRQRITGGKPVSPSTVNRTLWMLAAFGKWCVARSYHTANPWSLKSLPETQLPVPSVEPAQLLAVIVALPTRWRTLVEFAVETGLRKGELGRLRWADVDLGERLAWVVSSHARGLTKARKTRPATLSLRAVELLRSLSRRRDGAVFGAVGDPRRAFKRAATAAGLERVWLHLFRHVAASGLDARGASRADLVAFGGWSGSRMADRYSRSSHRRMLALLDADVRNSDGKAPASSRPASATRGDP